MARARAFGGGGGVIRARRHPHACGHLQTAAPDSFGAREYCERQNVQLGARLVGARPLMLLLMLRRP